MIATGRQDARAAIVTTLLVTLAVALLPTGSYLAYLLVWLAVATVAALSGIVMSQEPSTKYGLVVRTVLVVLGSLQLA